jgi:hypothetical protein
MRTIICLTSLAIFLSSISINNSVPPVAAKKTATAPLQRESTPVPNVPLPPDLIGYGGGALRSAASADTFLLHWATFDGPTGPDTMGYTSRDLTAQEAVYFHVADGTELDGGQFGNLLPLSGSKSMWCGLDASTAGPYCGYASLPGYGNGWDQVLESASLQGDSVSLSYKVFWDSEPNYDGAQVEYTFDGYYWYSFPINDTFSARPYIYDGTSPTPYITELVTNYVNGPPGGDVKVRFRFTSDGYWSDQDGLWQTDGAIIVDDITVNTWAAGIPAFSNTEDFESAPASADSAGIWTARARAWPAFGDFANLYPGVSVYQQDQCYNNMSFFWAFFDDPANSNYGCAGHPEQGAIPHGNEYCDYIHNRIESPLIPYTGSGDDVRLRFLVYRDMPLDNLVFYQWAVRSWVDGCPGVWRDTNFVYYGGQKDWFFTNFQIGQFIDPSASHIQITVGVADMCGVWCIFGCSSTPEGSCRGGAPYIDDIRVERISVYGPQYTVHHTNLFQDNFAEDGTLTGTARADAAIDIMPFNTTNIRPGDSVAVTIAPVGTDPHTGTGPAAYAYVAVRPSGQTGKTPADIEAPETREGGARWPLVGTTTIDDVEWGCYRMDNVIAGGTAADRYCIDLNDDVFTPGDTVFYFFAADADGTPGNGNEQYWHRTVEGQGLSHSTSDILEAAASPCEFTILPAGGYNHGGDILYVDDADDRGGPAQLFFDSAFELLGLRGRVDRYDVLGPSSGAGNSLASRVKDNTNQIIGVYRNILWNSAELYRYTLGGGSRYREKSDDYGLLYQFLDESDKGPGLYLSGDYIAYDWAGQWGTGAVQMRSVYMNHNVLDRNHINHGEVVSPVLTATGAAFIHMGVPDQLIAHGGCPLVNAFDVLQPTGTAIIEFPYPNSGDGAVISQSTLNAVGETATVVLSGFSFHYIRDAFAGYPPARVEHMRDILHKLGDILPQPTGIDPGPQPKFANFLRPAYPNPFNPTTTIVYGVKERGHVSLKVYNASGQLVRTLVNDVQTPGEVQPVTWDGTNDAGQFVSSGVYFYKLVTKGFSQTRKTVLLK